MSLPPSDKGNTEPPEPPASRLPAYREVDIGKVDAALPRPKETPIDNGSPGGS